MSDPVPTVEQLLSVVEQLRAEVAGLRAADAEQRAENEQLRAENAELKRRLGQNSTNSSRAPSGDRLERSPSRAQRRKAGRKPGKQPGERGFTLRRKEIADDTVDLVPSSCGGCGGDLAGARAVKVLSRQVCDIPDRIAAKFLDHRMHTLRCRCGHLTEHPAPAGVTAPVSYGPNLRALAAYLVVYQHVPVARAAELIADVTGARCSTGWISSVVAATGEAVALVDEQVRAALIAGCLLHVDETSISVNGQKVWLHVASTATLTAYFAHTSRGRAAVDDFAVLPKFTGVVVHDALSVYDGPKYTGATHARCGAHIARDLVAAGEADPENAWPTAALDALYELNTAAHTARAQGADAIGTETLEALITRWRHAVLCGLADNPRRDGRKQSKTRNLPIRLKTREDDVLRFARDLRVPFTNNQAERDLRPAKTQLKISGCHRSIGGARAWLRIRGYISTMRKNHHPVLAGLRAAISGNPWLPTTG